MAVPESIINDPFTILRSTQQGQKPRSMMDHSMVLEVSGVQDGRAAGVKHV